MISLAYVKYWTAISAIGLNHHQKYDKHTWCIINKIQSKYILFCNDY